MRILLGGQGDPIPPIALPDPSSSDAAVPVILLPVDGDAFDPADYLSLGYTHYEVWCVGAVGGQGADVASGIQWDVTVEQEDMPTSEWNKVVQSYIDVAQRSNVSSYSGVHPVGASPPPVGVISWDTTSHVLTPEGLAWYQHPAPHVFPVNYYSNPRPIESQVTGGGGGGGGLQVVSGRLDELPGPVPVVVGKPGADAPPGQATLNGNWDPVPVADDVNHYWMNYQGGNGGGENWFNRYPTPHPTFAPPGFGEDGGYSAFGDLCVASGGKGGGPAVIWLPDGEAYFAGHGGDGGEGGSMAAGGGAQGANNPQTTAQGKVGAWDPISRIGEGGGGGRGGMAGVAAPPPMMGGTS